MSIILNCWPSNELRRQKCLSTWVGVPYKNPSQVRAHPSTYHQLPQPIYPSTTKTMDHNGDNMVKNERHNHDYLLIITRIEDSSPVIAAVDTTGTGTTTDAAIATIIAAGHSAAAGDTAAAGVSAAAGDSRPI